MILPFYRFQLYKKYECTLECSLYSYLNDWVIYIIDDTETYRIYLHPIKNIYQDFDNFEKAEKFLYDLYCDELSLTEGY